MRAAFQRTRRDEGAKNREANSFLLRGSSLLRFFAFSLLFASIAVADDFKQVTGPRQWSFPRDHGRHDGYKTEWWYFTGNLRDASSRRFGFQLTFFRAAMTPTPATRPSPWGMNDLYFSHAAVSDIGGQTFLFKDRLQRGRPGLADSSDRTMNVSLLDSLAILDEKGTIHLTAHEDAFSMDLSCAPGRGPILQGPGGVNAKGLAPGQASYYYSMTRLPTAGSLIVNGKRVEVQGNTWMDHEFSSNALSSNQAGWDWLGLTLADGSDLMIYRLRDHQGGTDYLSGTRVTTDGKPHYLSSEQITLAGSNPWKSPATGGTYPQRWMLAIRGQSPVVIRSLMPGQELVTTASTNVNYFEGAVEVLSESGKPAGEGYLEMTGTAKPLTEAGMSSMGGKN